MNTNQYPEQIARDKIDRMLRKAGWVVQSKDRVDLNKNLGVAVREYQTEAGPADYVLFVDRKPVGVIEAKREEEGQRLTVAEDQALKYASSKLKYLDNDPLPFVYESTGVVTRFTNYDDPKPRGRPIFHFHKPQTLYRWFHSDNTLRERLFQLPELDTDGLRKAQVKAIKNLEQSFRENQPKALIQMATGAGKTFTACTFVYRLLKFAKAKRILFVVDTKNLGEQAEQEFLKFQPNDDPRKFTELYNVHRLTSSFIPSDSQVCISTIQRLYSILKGEDLPEDAEETDPNEYSWKPKEPVPVEYSPDHPIEQFDFIVIDECHRSIYNLWKQVLDYYDAFLIGLTATPDKRTFGFFNKNVVSEYTYEESVIDGVNVPFDVFTIETKMTAHGGRIEAKEYVDKREKLTRKQRWEQLDEDFEYSGKQLDKDVVSPDQIRTVIRTFKNALPTIFPDRFDEDGEFEVPKTLVFAKTDSHCDDIIQVIREEFGEGNEFCKKVTYKAEDDPKSVINRFRNSWAPRIAVTVNMIATGTDVKPLEVLLFMRDVKSKNYFEQMKGRGTRTIQFDDLKKVTRTAQHTKTHFVIIDAVGATKSKKTDSRPLERERSVPMKDLLGAVAMGVVSEDVFTSLANRLIRLDKQMTEKEKAKIASMCGASVNTMVRKLLEAHDPDVIHQQIKKKLDAIPVSELTDEKEEQVQKEVKRELARKASEPFTGEMNDYLDNVRKVHEQIIDNINQDELMRAEWETDATENAQEIVTDFTDYIEEHKDEITALSIFYDQPYKRRELTFAMIKELLETIKLQQPRLAPSIVWEAYEQIGDVKSKKPMNELVALVSLIRKVSGIDQQLTAYDKTVDKNFQDWVFQKQAGSVKFSEEQMTWLRNIKNHIATSFHMSKEDFELDPFNKNGGLGKFYQLFKDEYQQIIDELNEELVA